MNKLYPLQAGAPMFTIVPMAPVAPTMETDGATHGPITRTPPQQQMQVQVQMQPQQQPPQQQQVQVQMQPQQQQPQQEQMQVRVQPQQQQMQQQQQQQQQQVRVQQQVNPLSNTTHGSVQITVAPLQQHPHQEMDL